MDEENIHVIPLCCQKCSYLSDYKCLKEGIYCSQTKCMRKNAILYYLKESSRKQGGRLTMIKRPTFLSIVYERIRRAILNSIPCLKKLVKNIQISPPDRIISK